MSDRGHCTAGLIQRALRGSGGSGRPVTSPETTVGKGLSDGPTAGTSGGTEYFSETLRKGRDYSVIQPPLGLGCSAQTQLGFFTNDLTQNKFVYPPNLHPPQLSSSDPSLQSGSPSHM